MPVRNHIFEGPCSCIGHPAEEHDDKGCTHVSGAGTRGEHRCPCRGHWVSLEPVPESVASRDPAIQEALRWLVPNPKLPLGRPADIAALFWDFACELLKLTGDGRQLKHAINRLTEAKDAAVRQAIVDGGS